VPEAEPETVMVVGAVTKPGMMSIFRQKQRDLLRIVTLTSPTPLADLRRTTIYRGGEQIVANLQAVIDEGKLAENVDVEPDDVIMIPEKETLYVLGAVGHQGKLAWEPDMDILDALTQTGGILPTADPRSVSVVRTRPDGTSEHIILSVAELSEGIPPAPHELKPGDIIYVKPRHVKRPILTLIRDALWTFGAIMSVID